MIAPAMTPRVLVVDDEPAMLGAVRRIVQKGRPDAVVVYASDVATATWQLRTTAVRLVITDLRMGSNAEAGWAVVEAAQSLGVPAAIITGCDAPETLRRAQALGVSVMRKPVEAAVLTSLVEDAFSAPSSRMMGAVTDPVSVG